MNKFEANDRVRLKIAPDNIGRTTGLVRTSKGRLRYQVDFGDKLNYVLEGNLEIVDQKEDIYTLLEKHKFGSLINLRSAITHSRLTGRLSDVVYSMEASNTEFYPYQFKPVLNFLDSPSNGILIADEVGLGKTIEAGLIWTELRARFNANRLLILCPAVLREKWQEELINRFGIKADIDNAETLLKKLKIVENNKMEGFASICSIQGLRPPKGWDNEINPGKASTQLAQYLRLMESEDPMFDCVIIDEAHYMRNEQTQTHKLARLLRDVSEYMVLLSATPIQLRSDDLFYLLKLIDAENFEYIESFKEIIQANKPLIKLADSLRRIGGKSYQQSEFIQQVKSCIGHHLLKNKRQLKSLLEKPPTEYELQSTAYRVKLANRIERINLLARVVNRTRKKDVHENKVIRYPVAYKATMTEMEQHFYNEVTNSVREYCIGKDINDAFILTMPQRQICSSMPAAFRAWKKKINGFVDESQIYESGIETDKKSKREIGPLVQILAEKVGEICDYNSLKNNDSKFSTLLEQLSAYWKKNPDNKVILFSFYKETLRYLNERLIEQGYETQLLMGGMRETKHDVIDKFRKSQTSRILLASEVASEGVDLQFSSFLINYDLPWNPMRVEQRIGRIDRIGQKENRINILNLFYANTLDERIYQRLYERLDVFKEALGDLEAILGEEIKKLTLSLLTHKLTKAEEEQKIEQSALAIETVKSQQKRLEDEASQLAAHSDYVLNRVKAAREMRRYIDGENLWFYIKDFLNRKYKGCDLIRLSDSDLSTEIQLSNDAVVDFLSYLDKNKSINRSRLSSGERINCVFTNKVYFNTPKYEVINQYHPLVRFVSHQISSELFHPLISAELGIHDAMGHTKGTYLILCELWSTNGAKTIEKLVYKGIDLNSTELIDDDKAESLISSSITYAVEWAGVKSFITGNELLEYFDELRDKLDEQFFEYADYMRIENNDNVDYLIGALNKKISGQIHTIQEVIENLKAKNYERLIPANRGRIKKLQNNLEIKTGVYEQKRTINTEQDLVMVGVINVS